MLPTCPSCGYDLTGSQGLAGALCPECGGLADIAALRITLRKQAARFWRWFFFSPFLAAPAFMLYGIGQPILAFILSSYFAARALFRIDDLLGLRRQPIVNTLAAVLLAFAWTSLSSVVLGLVALAVLPILGIAR